MKCFANKQHVQVRYINDFIFFWVFTIVVNNKYKLNIIALKSSKSYQNLYCNKVTWIILEDQVSKSWVHSVTRLLNWFSGLKQGVGISPFAFRFLLRATKKWTLYNCFLFSGVYNEATNEIVTGGVGNVTVSTALRQCIF